MNLPKNLAEEAAKIVGIAKDEGIILRVMGACAVRIHCTKYRYLLEKFKRELTDLDFVSYEIFEPVMEKFFGKLGYVSRTYMPKMWGRAGIIKRHIYIGKKTGVIVDVFFDKLEMCHTIDFKGRLEIDYPTISLADLLLEKAQIVKINEKDVKDIILLLREHEVGVIDAETINAAYIAKLLSNDWGFYYTVVTNLNNVKSFARAYAEREVLTKEDLEDISVKINKLLQFIEKEPKSMRWKLRAKIGTRKKWYNDVEEALLPGTVDK
jgi:hypothetical protein